MKAIRKEIMPFLNLTYVQTDKFKTSLLGVNLLLQLKKETAAKNALLPMVLNRGTARYPDIDSIKKKTDELYGTGLGYNFRKKGEVHCISLNADFIDDAYIPGGERLLEEVFGLVGEVLCAPVLENGLLKAEYVESEKQNLIRSIRAKINDKGRYAMSRMTELMCEGEAFAIDGTGSEEEALTINSENLTAHYKEILRSAPIEVFYCGNAELDRVEAALRAALSGLPERTAPKEKIGTVIRMEPVGPGVRCVHEEMAVTQGNLALGFRLGKCMENLDAPALMVFSILYSSVPNSKLFNNVREKLSLCYSINGGADPFKGLLLVSAGIEFDKYQQTVDEIMIQLDAVKNGDITDAELEMAKGRILNSLRSTWDSAGALEDFYLGEAVERRMRDPRELLEQVKTVDKNRVQKIAESIQPDMIYFLKGIEGGRS